jgi:hypothetical protein
MKNLNLIVIIFFLSISAKCQVIGFEGQYGVDNYLDGVIEGIVEKENSGKLYINRDFGQGPTILTYPETIYIGGYYNKSIIYNKSNPSLEITFYKDNSQKIIIKRIEYSSDNKRTYPYVNGKYPSDYRSILNEDFNGNLENIINNEINIVRNSLNGYDPNYLVQFNSRKNQNNNNDKKLLTGKIKKWQNKKVFSGNDCDDLFDDDVLAEKNNMLKEAILLITIRLNKCKTTEKFFVIKKRA